MVYAPRNTPAMIQSQQRHGDDGTPAHLRHELNRLLAEHRPERRELDAILSRAGLPLADVAIDAAPRERWYSAILVAERDGKLPALLRAAIAHAGSEGPLLAGLRAIERDLGPAREEERGVFPGLGYFDERDAAWFFGREVERADVLDRLRAKDPPRRWLMIEGDSGVGKSSFVRAGLVPQLRAGALGAARVALFRPGRDPLLALASALADARGGASAEGTIELIERREDAVALAADEVSKRGERLVLVIDQFEECFTLSAQDEERLARFDRALAWAVARSEGLLVTAVRRDQLTGFNRLPALQALLNDPGRVPYVLLPMAVDTMGGMLERSVSEAGGRWADGLVQRILKDVAGTPLDGAKTRVPMPLVANLLQQLWRRRAEEWLTHEAYEALGGARGSLRSSVEQVLGSLAPGRKPVVRELILKLIRVRVDAPAVRAPRRETELIESFRERRADVHEVLQVLSGARGEAPVRLVVVSGRRDAESDDAEVDLIHEAILYELPVREWVESERNRLRLCTEVEDHARRWAERRREGQSAEGLLLSDALLDEYQTLHAEDFAEKLPGEYLAESRRVQRASRRRRRTQAAVALALLAGVAGAIAWGYRKQNATIDRVFEQRWVERQVGSVPSGVADAQRALADATARVGRRMRAGEVLGDHLPLALSTSLVDVLYATVAERRVAQEIWFNPANQGVVAILGGAARGVKSEALFTFVQGDRIASSNTWIPSGQDAWREWEMQLVPNHDAIFLSYRTGRGSYEAWRMFTRANLTQSPEHPAPEFSHEALMQGPAFRAEEAIQHSEILDVDLQLRSFLVRVGGAWAGVMHWAGTSPAPVDSTFPLRNGHRVNVNGAQYLWGSQGPSANRRTLSERLTVDGAPLQRMIGGNVAWITRSPDGRSLAFSRLITRRDLSLDPVRTDRQLNPVRLPTPPGYFQTRGPLHVWTEGAEWEPEGVDQLSYVHSPGDYGADLPRSLSFSASGDTLVWIKNSFELAVANVRARSVESVGVSEGGPLRDVRLVDDRRLLLARADGRIELFDLPQRRVLDAVLCRRALGIPSGSTCVPFREVSGRQRLLSTQGARFAVTVNPSPEASSLWCGSWIVTSTLNGVVVMSSDFKQRTSYEATSAWCLEPEGSVVIQKRRGFSILTGAQAALHDETHRFLGRARVEGEMLLATPAGEGGRSRVIRRNATTGRDRVLGEVEVGGGELRTSRDGRHLVAFVSPATPPLPPAIRRDIGSRWQVTLGEGLRNSASRVELYKVNPDGLALEHVWRPTTSDAGDHPVRALLSEDATKLLIWRDGGASVFSLEGHTGQEVVLEGAEDLWPANAASDLPSIMSFSRSGRFVRLGDDRVPPWWDVSTGHRAREEDVDAVLHSFRRHRQVSASMGGVWFGDTPRLSLASRNASVLQLSPEGDLALLRLGNYRVVLPLNVEDLFRLACDFLVDAPRDIKEQVDPFCSARWAEGPVW